ncbi:hypothetical protein LTR37_017921 [Vermiconidia calcicola]|uniref:Uncharacterized protein n=1 Tax=Vermiconidia calcicola TaxID=1690605 RepID=A0ACC3MIF7_9PEZI|nr:hypothetical protein LTR37_017921 [Vermiconidia calcicola]
MSFFQAPSSFRLRELADTALNFNRARSIPHAAGGDTQLPMLMASMANATMVDTLQDHSTHPNFLHLAGLVCEAVLEVVFVALPGFAVAASGMFDANSQKFVAELNVMVFTPCLIWSKLAGQLNADKLADLAVIPVIFAAQTLVSWISAQGMARLFGFAKKKRQKNFIIAMGVFGNSNSLPISLVLSLSKTISGLHWDKVPGDNDDEVAARGILYLMIFQQLGQLLRWTWGYSVLLKPASAYEEADRAAEVEEERATEEGRYRDDPEDEVDGQVPKQQFKPTDSGFGSGSQTPLSSTATSESSDNDELIPATADMTSENPRRMTSHSESNGHLYERARSTNHITTFPNFSNTSSHKNSGAESAGWKQPFINAKLAFLRFCHRALATLSTFFHNLFRSLPSPIQKTLSVMHYYNSSFWAGVWRQMNPPLWAMLAALIVASIPDLQRVFFTPGTFINNSVTRAITQSGGVAVPLILVVLGANLARSTLPKDQLATSPEDVKEERRLLFASLISRMLLPTIIMAPILALMAKYVPVSILDDPIFIIVCFLLTGAPSALQLAQICQINSVFMGAMSNLLVASYVVAIFPSTLTLVLLALEVLEWAVINN